MGNFTIKTYFFLLVLLILFFTASPTATFAQTSSQTITFNDKSGQNQVLNGQYPTNVINWGTNKWYHSGPWGLFTTKSVSFNGSNQTSGTFTFITAKRLISLKAYNGGSVTSTVTLACTGNTNKVISVPVNQIITINTDWTNACSAITIQSTNGWNTNFDDLVYDNGDSTPPSVAITSPANSETVVGNQTITASASDNVAIAGVQFKVNGVNIGAEDTTAPYSVSWDSKTVANGTHSLTAVARDTSNNSTTSTAVSISVNNPPLLVIAQPSEGASISGSSITVQYTSTGDQTEADHAHFRLDGGDTKMDIDFDGSYTFNNVPPGNHTIVGIIARSDHTEISGSEDTVTFSTTLPDTTAPTVSVTNPANASTVSGTISVSANASDDVALAGVQFKVDGTNIGSEDTTVPYSVSWNSTTTTNGSHTITAVARDTSNNSTISNPITITVENQDPRAQVGEWSSVMNWPLVSVHGSLLNSGKVLLWDAWEYGTTQAKVWDPVTNTFENKPVNDQLFCAAHATLSNGGILTTGGHNGGEVGINSTNIFNPTTNSWQTAPDMAFDRWYPSNIKLGDGRVVTLSGQITPGNFADTPEIYDPNTNTWSSISVSTSSMHDSEYPLTFLLPNGKIYSLAATPGSSYLLDVIAPSWTTVNTLPSNLGSAAMYRPGKILYTGGGNTKESGEASKTQASVIDMTQTNPSWRTIASMAYPRYQHNLTLLPDGKVMAIGGTPVVSQTTSQGILPTEIWNPDDENWTTTASIAHSRNYHSISMLLPDGKVLSAGGGRLGGAPDRFTAQLYSPPYLFKGSRPIIDSAPTTTDYGTQMTIISQQANAIEKVTFIPLASVTHTLDMNQRYLELPFTKSGNQLTVDSPNDPNLAPPGYYMLFILNGNGVPSESKIVKMNVLADTQSPVVNLTAPTNNSTVLNTITISANATDNVKVDSVQFLLDNNNLGPADTTAPYSINWDTKTATNGTHVLTARAVDSSGNSTTSSSISVTVDNPPDTTAPVISNIQATNITTTTATITWTTDESADSKVRYGTTAAYGSDQSNSTPVLNHSVQLTGLTANTTYHYQVVSKDSSNNESVSNDLTFSTPNSQPQTITFDDKSGQDQVLNGQYPTNVINWGTNSWWHSSPWGQFTTKSISFNGGGQTTGSFTFITPKKLLSFKAFNGGSVTTTLTLSCSGNTNKQVTIPANTLTTVSTDWINTCTTVTFSNTNGWNTNFDDLVIDN